jgi:hypothetical protein
VPGHLLGAPGLTSRHQLQIGTWFKHHELLIVLIVLGIFAVFILLLLLPVLSSASYYAFSSGFRKSAWGTFLAGLGVLIVGLASGVRIIEIAGGGIMAAVVIGIIVDQYLRRRSWSRSSLWPASGPSADLTELRHGSLQVVH